MARTHKGFVKAKELNDVVDELEDQTVSRSIHVEHDCGILDRNTEDNDQHKSSMQPARQAAARKSRTVLCCLLGLSFLAGFVLEHLWPPPSTMPSDVMPLLASPAPAPAPAPAPPVPGPVPGLPSPSAAPATATSGSEGGRGRGDGWGDGGESAAGNVASRFLPPEQDDTAPRQFTSGYTGGCRNFVQRAFFGAKLGCSVTTACELCANATCVTPTDTSGTKYPRENVPQYLGNGVWDGHSLEFSGAIKAMMGDPFSFTVSPEMAALARKLSGQSPLEMVDQMKKTWWADGRFPAEDTSTLTARGAFFVSLMGLTSEHVDKHMKYLSNLVGAPRAVRDRISASLGISSRAYEPQSGTWHHHPNTNCYDGRGGVSLRHFGAEWVPAHSVQSCKWECLNNLACQGFVHNLFTTSEFEPGKQRVDELGNYWFVGVPGRCFLLSYVAVDEGEWTDNFDLYTLDRNEASDAAPPDPSPNPNTLGPEAATCAAAFIVDAKFEASSAHNLWVSNIDPERTPEMNRSALFTSLYLPADSYSEDPLENPHSDVYTTIYQTHALGFYGGNVTFVYAPAEDEGSSGFDIDWAQTRMCPGSPPVGFNVNQWNQNWCWDRRNKEYVKDSAANPDAGELRTPNYKAPRELNGIMLHERGAFPPVWTTEASDGFDLSTLARPIQWAFFKADLPQVNVAGGLAGDDGDCAVIVVLAPSAAQPCYGVHSVGSPQRFVAAPDQPRVITPMHDTAQVSPGVPFRMSEVAQPTDRRLPVWGVLHRCAQTNVDDAQGAGVTDPLVAVADGGREKERICNAASVLREQRTAATMDTATDAAVSGTKLPDDVRQFLNAMNVWPGNAYVDLSVSSSVLNPGRQASDSQRDAVCILSLDALDQIDATNACS